MPGDSGDAIAREGAGLFAHNPRRPIETTRPVNRNTVRPAPICCGDRKNDHERCDRIEVARRGDHEDGSMASLLTATYGLKCCPDDDTGCEI
jgi:hypothetical protein